ncbi:uncharacterized protein si:dkeyp-117h8.4 [Syngnathoides biaculeatus]|uniref:uncharacterized protein si:dkeyp-117h8.4 n=1 Tax=Syngnathoides biaculeatus TaxID=300417 RepID=UPI002ADE59C5|nr:uncharacterized protein si:dkeyp-117h8.4 [Syngnathoides biaculeatus]
MEAQMKQQLTLNDLRYKRSLRRIIDKYSFMACLDETMDVDLNITSGDELAHYMLLTKKQFREMKSKSLLDSRDDLFQSHNSSLTAQLDQTEQDGRDETVSSWMFTDGDDDDDNGASIAHPQQSPLDGTQRNLFETDVLPEDQDEELEMSMRSQGSTLFELYPGMLERIGRASHWWHVTNVADGVRHKYRKLRRQPSRGNHIQTSVGDDRQTASKKGTVNPGSNCSSWQRFPLRDQNVLVLASPKPKSKPNETFIVGERPPSEVSSDMLLESRKLMGEQPSSCFLSPSQSSDGSSGVSLDRPRSARKLFLSVDRNNQQSSCRLSPLQSPGSSLRPSLGLPLISKEVSLSATTGQPSSWVLSPSRSSGSSSIQSLNTKSLSSTTSPTSRVISPSQPSSPSADLSLRSKSSLWLLSPSQYFGPSEDQSLRSIRISNVAAQEQKQPSSCVLSPSQSSSPSKGLSLKYKRLALSAAQEEKQPSSCVLGPPQSSSLSGDLFLRSKRLALSVAQEQNQPSLCMLSPSQSFSPSKDQSLRSKRLYNTPGQEQKQPSSCVLSSSQSSSPSRDLSLRSKRLAISVAQEQKQPSWWMLSPSQSFDPSKDWSLRFKTLYNTPGQEQKQPSSCVLSPLLSSYPHSDLSISPKKCFSSACNASGSTQFKERSDLDVLPVKHGPIKEGVVIWEGLTRSPQPYSQSTSSAHVLYCVTSRPPPLRNPLTHQIRDPKSSSVSSLNGRDHLWRHNSTDSSHTSSCLTYSEKDLDDDYVRQYHKFVCQSEAFNGPPCRTCAGSAHGHRRHSSQSLAALALSPHRLRLKKRHRDSEWENLFHSKRWSPYSPGSKRHRNEVLRRRLCYRDREAPRGGVFEDSAVRSFNSRPQLEEDYLLGIPGEENMSASY